ncbi:hypothetical protein R4K54_08530 [Brachyspira murdochii]|nr:hypothetical protein [Brachyspira murdochii]
MKQLPVFGAVGSRETAFVITSSFSAEVNLLWFCTAVFHKLE